MNIFQRISENFEDRSWNSETFFLLIALIDENVLITSLLLNPMFQTLKQVGRNGGRMMEYQDLVSGVFFLIIQENI